MRTLLTIAALCSISAGALAHQHIDPANVNADNVRTCIEERLVHEERETVIASMREKLNALFENGEISEATYESALEVVNAYTPSA